MKAAILDIDGTLVDTNYHHALAWFRAFRQFGHVVPIWQIHRTIGMGGDQLIKHLLSEAIDEEQGDDIRAAEGSLYLADIEEVEPFRGARELIEKLNDQGKAVVLASSAKAQEVDHYLDLLDARSLVTGWTSAAEVQKTKPHPDLLEAALKIAGTRDAIMVGDSVWDCEAAKRAGLDLVAVLTGGFSADELKDAGAMQVYESIGDLHGRFADSPLA